MNTLRDVVDLLHTWYPPGTADSWDAVGLVSGDPDREVRKVAFAVDPTEPVAREAVAWGADLLVVHHPLFLKPVHSVAATTPKGRTLQVLTEGGCALLTAHTNADQALTGVSESLGLALGLDNLVPLVPAPASGALETLVTYVPHSHAEQVRAALAGAGAGRIGDYDRASFTGTGQGRFRPLPGAQPHLGAVGEVEVVEEQRIEVVLTPGRRGAVLEALRTAHPYEEPAFHVLRTEPTGPALTGTGRVGDVASCTLAEFAQRVAEALPVTAQGVRVAGDPDRPVRRVALCGGAGDFLLDQVATSDADVYLTSDLRHHPAAEFVEKDGPALVDVAHWAAEWTWLPRVATRLGEALGDTVSTHVSTLRTDPWSFRVGARDEGDLR